MTALRAYLHRALASAPVVVEPGAHAEIADLLPGDVYEQLLQAMPAEEQCECKDKYKYEFCPSEPTPTASARTVDAWGWFERDVIGGVLTPLLVEHFRPLIEARYRELFGSALLADALSWPLSNFRGRLLLRRPGYRLRPHRDKKTAVLTGLIYFARPGDCADYGTQLYAVEDDREAPHNSTFYPEDYGARPRFARTVPFRANTALVFLNRPGMAHAAFVPRDSAQAERYAYQFYIGPPKVELIRLLASAGHR